MKRVTLMLAAMTLTALLVDATTDPFSAGGLGSLPKLKDFTAGRQSSFDPTGGNADGRHDMPLLPGETRTMAEIQGAGAITHVWITIATEDAKHLKNYVLRMYWDGEKDPSVEAPLGDFFGLGHGMYYHYASLPIQIGASRGLNCFWRMPFSRGARVTVTNDGPLEGEAFYYYVDYAKYDSLSEDVGRFHAQYRQAYPCRPREHYTILEARGRGHFVGCNLSVHIRAAGWWGEGDDLFYIDGAKQPQLQGTGSEDYFCGAWAYGYGEPFSTQYFGAPLIKGLHEQNAVWNVYRYHIEDPIPFAKSIEVLLEHGHANSRSDDFSSVAYWYQTEPHVPFPPLPAPEKRFHTEATVYTEPWASEAEAFVPMFANDDVVVQETAGFANQWSHGRQLLIQAAAPATYRCRLPVEASEAGGQVFKKLWYTAGPNYGRCELWVNDEKVYEWDGYSPGKVVRKTLDFPAQIILRPSENTLEIRVTGKNKASSGYWVGWDCYILDPL